MKEEIILFFIGNKHLLTYLCIPLLITHLMNVILEYINKKRNYNNIEKGKKGNNKSKFITFYLCFIVIALIFLFTKIPYLKTIINIINITFLLYILIIAPLFNREIFYSFKESNTMMSAFLLLETTYIISKIELSFYEAIKNQQILQIMIILTIFFVIFLTIYVLLINIRMILFYLSTIFLEKANENIKIIIDDLKEKYNDKTITKELEKSQSKIDIYKKATKLVVLYTIFIIIISSLLYVIYYFLNIYNNNFNTINNRSLYNISKVAIISTVFIVYLIIQISSYFSTPIISSYEFVSSTIVIPLLLDGLLKTSSQKKA